MKYLYLYLNIGSFIIPFLFSFHPKIRFDKEWKYIFPGIGVMMAIFIPWDILFTINEFWGFNPAYLSGIEFLHLPIEEWMFFICIPYACLFTHHALSTLVRNWSFGERTTGIIYVSLICVLVICLWYFYDRWYTLVNFSFALIVLGIIYNKHRELLKFFLPSYLVILIPFFIVNGVLTGSWIEDQVVWYNNAENMGVRLGTIPVEDLIYNLCMLITPLLVVRLLRKTPSTS